MYLSVGKTMLEITLSNERGIVAKFIKKVVCVLLNLIITHCQQQRNVPCVKVHSTSLSLCF